MADGSQDEGRGHLLGSFLSVVEMLKGGTTAFVDMYDHMDQVASIVDQSGMRGVLMRGVIGLCPLKSSVRS